MKMMRILEDDLASTTGKGEYDGAWIRLIHLENQIKPAKLMLEHSRKTS
jgi:hypothetical protein